MKSREVIQMLKEDGWYLVRVKGDHHHFKHPKKAGLVTVPHPTKDIKLGTLKSIKKQAQLS
ncbi:type II toxin-antitoxin system HicA family toxin [Maribrevibacterium harenarium]|uniref:Type II toxin-antitoxin system HicA family toxin n=1 Tax=Maribrevibacterium harenarium TaxID=2589817 RepID=A0A501WZN6_9GAMM|nr:type II toxin-antitoxin system HicA family toxin [Maribrevibacterium harenarium]TPE54270.1 type II toxin-antitoxin system HicA family toxin [Maribrevibacterium harenarium]